MMLPFALAVLLPLAPAARAQDLPKVAAPKIAGKAALLKASLDLQKENMIYVADLRLQDPKAAKAKVLAQLKEIVAKVNAGFEAKKLPQRAEVLEDVSKVAAAADLKASSVLATIGTTPQLVRVQAELEKKGFDQIGIEGMGAERASSWGAARFLANGDYAPDEDRGDRLAVNLDALHDYLAAFKIGQVEFIAWVIQHGSAHNAALNHNNDMPNRQASSGFDSVPDLTTSGQYFLNHKDRFATDRDKVGDKLRGLFTSTGKFKKS